MTELSSPITPLQLSHWRSNGTEHQLIDIREEYEVDTCSIADVHIPMGEISARVGEIRRDIPVIIHCKSGPRSAAVVEHLQRLGFTNVSSLEGGIIAWIDAIDPSLERY
jgi:sulfur-carrier protein adenylyltransferase/sulfurtransferase